MMALPTTTLVLGGARSGKSSYAEQLVEVYEQGVYLATAPAAGDDAEMAERIQMHRDRRGPMWHTFEESLELSEAITKLARADRPILVDCLTLWLSNLMFAERDPEAATEDLIRALSQSPGPVVLVSNEVGMGIVPENTLARAFRDCAGRMNQIVAGAADRVIFVAAGLPLIMKDENT